MNSTAYSSIVCYHILWALSIHLPHTYTHTHTSDQRYKCGDCRSRFTPCTRAIYFEVYERYSNNGTSKMHAKKRSAQLTESFQFHSIHRMCACVSWVSVVLKQTINARWPKYKVQHRLMHWAAQNVTIVLTVCIFCIFALVSFLSAQCVQCTLYSARVSCIVEATDTCIAND